MSNALTIGQVAAATGLTTHTLRYYEQAGLLHAVGRTEAGHRLYSLADLDWLQFVMRLKATGMPIAGMQAFAQLRGQGAATFDARRVMLDAHRVAVQTRIAELQTNLAAITDKIDWYVDALQTAEVAAQTPPNAPMQHADRHDESSPLQPQEQDSPWNRRNSSAGTPTRASESTRSTRKPAATRGAGKS